MMEINSGVVGALLAFVLFYGLVHYLPRRSERFVDHIRRDPVPLIVGLCAAILAFYFFAGENLSDEADIHKAVVSSIAQLLLLIILGGAVTAIYQVRLQAREDAERQRAERVAITEPRQFSSFYDEN